MHCARTSRAISIDPHEHLLLGNTAQITQVRRRLRTYAELPYPVLIQGETGTGKEYAARYLYAHGHAANTPFVSVNCGTLHQNLATPTLFGSRRGAFTGAEARDGLIRKANGGVLFLDEIADLSDEVQVMLLRILETGQLRAVGSDTTCAVKFRLICATHKQLETEVRRGRFRQDLYFRLSILRIRMPALRERLQDLPLLVRALSPSESATPATNLMKALYNYQYPGNLRELRNLLISISANTHGPESDEALLKRLMLSQASPTTQSLTLNRKISEYIRECYVQEGGNVRRTARKLDVSPNTVYRHLSLLGVASEPFS